MAGNPLPYTSGHSDMGMPRSIIVLRASLVPATQLRSSAPFTLEREKSYM